MCLAFAFQRRIFTLIMHFSVHKIGSRVAPRGFTDYVFALNFCRKECCNLLFGNHLYWPGLLRNFCFSTTRALKLKALTTGYSLSCSECWGVPRVSIFHWASRPSQAARPTKINFYFRCDQEPNEVALLVGRRPAGPLAPRAARYSIRALPNTALLLAFLLFAICSIILVRW